MTSKDSEITIKIAVQDLVIETKSDKASAGKGITTESGHDRDKRIQSYQDTRDGIQDLLSPFLFGKVFEQGIHFKDSSSIKTRIVRKISRKKESAAEGLYAKLFSDNAAVIKSAAQKIEMALSKDPQDPDLHALSVHARLSLANPIYKKKLSFAFSLLVDAARVIYNNSLTTYHLGIFLKAYSRYLALWKVEEKKRLALPRKVLEKEGIKRITKEIERHKQLHVEEKFTDLFKFKAHYYFYHSTNLLAGECKKVDKKKYFLINEKIIHLSAQFKEMVKVPVLEKLVIEQLGELPKSRSDCDPNHYGLLLFIRIRFLRTIPRQRKLEEAKNFIYGDSQMVCDEATELFDFHDYTCEQYLPEFLEKPLDKKSYLLLASGYLTAPLLIMGALLSNELNIFEDGHETGDPDFINFKQDVIKTHDLLASLEKQTKAFSQSAKIKKLHQQCGNWKYQLGRIMAKHGWLG